MNDCTIRYATVNDIDAIMLFIKQYWSETHILANNRSFFEYEFRKDNDVHFAIAINNTTGLIDALVGFIPYGIKNADISTAIWKSNSKINPVQGINVLNHLLNDSNFRLRASPGVGQNTIPIYDYLKIPINKLTQYYRLSKQKEFCIAHITDFFRMPVQESESELIEIETFKDFEAHFNYIEYESNNPKPFKEKWYIEKRYFHHPIYTYKCFGIKESASSQCNSVFFAREVHEGKGKIIRIVDLLGKVTDLCLISKHIDDLLEKNNYEYIDFYQYGISEEIMNTAGFSKRKNTSNIIPNYFEPFVQKNIDIYFFATSLDNLLLFKGDGDQDRPSKV